MSAATKAPVDVDKDVAARVYVMLLDGYTRAHIAGVLNADAVPALTPHAPWAAPSVSLIRRAVEQREEFRHIRAMARYRQAHKDWAVDYTAGGFNWTAEELQEAARVAIDITYSVGMVRKRKSRALIQGEL